MAYDLLVKGGLVIDPFMEIKELKDVAIEGNQIVAVEKTVSTGSAKKVIDASGLVVAPGLIDLHAHVAKNLMRLCVDPDTAGLNRGTTTIVDAGSTGELLFQPFRRYVIESSRIRVLAFINIESLGMIEFVDREPENSDQTWSRLLMQNGEEFASAFVNVQNTLGVIQNNRDVIVGIKWAHHGLKILELARETADLSKTKVMAENHYQPELLKYLRRGDIITHLYHHSFNKYLKKYDGISEDRVKIIPEIFDASKKGIFLDVGHGQGSFSWRIAEAALREGLKPDIISTDLWVGNIAGPVYDLPTTMAKFMELGMSVEELIGAVTAKPAEALGLSGTIGTLKPGTCADVILLHQEEGKFPLVDCYGESRTGSKRLEPVHVIRNGSLIF